MSDSFSFYMISAATGQVLAQTPASGTNTTRAIFAGATAAYRPQGASTAVVYANVKTTSSTGDGGSFLRAFNGASGQQLFSAALPDGPGNGVSLGPPPPSASGAAATPRAIYVGTAYCRLYAKSAVDGSSPIPGWTAAYANPLGSSQFPFLTGSTVAVSSDGNTLFMSCGNQGTFAFASANGAKLWGQPAYGTGAFVALGANDASVVFQQTDQKIISLNAATGALVWSFDASQGSGRTISPLTNVAIDAAGTVYAIRVSFMGSTVFALNGDNGGKLCSLGLTPVAISTAFYGPALTRSGGLLIPAGRSLFLVVDGGAVLASPSALPPGASPSPGAPVVSPSALPFVPVAMVTVTFSISGLTASMFGAYKLLDSLDGTFEHDLLRYIETYLPPDKSPLVTLVASNFILTTAPIRFAMDLQVNRDPTLPASLANALQTTFSNAVLTGAVFTSTLNLVNTAAQGGPGSGQNALVIAGVTITPASGVVSPLPSFRPPSPSPGALTSVQFSLTFSLTNVDPSVLNPNNAAAWGPVAAAFSAVVYTQATTSLQLTVPGGPQSLTVSLVDFSASDAASPSPSFMRQRALQVRPVGIYVKVQLTIALPSSTSNPQLYLDALRGLLENYFNILFSSVFALIYQTGAVPQGYSVRTFIAAYSYGAPPSPGPNSNNNGGGAAKPGGGGSGAVAGGIIGGLLAAGIVGAVGFFVYRRYQKASRLTKGRAGSVSATIAGAPASRISVNPLQAGIQAAQTAQASQGPALEMGMPSTAAKEAVVGSPTPLLPRPQHQQRV